MFFIELHCFLAFHHDVHSRTFPVAKAKNDKAAASAVLDCVGLEKEKFRLGHTKVFFRAGVLGHMEEVREDRVGEVLSWLQAY